MYIVCLRNLEHCSWNDFLTTLGTEPSAGNLCLGKQIEAVPFGTVRPCKDAEFWLFYLEFNSDYIDFAVAWACNQSK